MTFPQVVVPALEVRFRLRSIITASVIWIDFDSELVPPKNIDFRSRFRFFPSPNATKPKGPIPIDGFLGRELELPKREQLQQVDEPKEMRVVMAPKPSLLFLCQMLNLKRLFFPRASSRTSCNRDPPPGAINANSYEISQNVFHLQPIPAAALYERLNLKVPDTAPQTNGQCFLARLIFYWTLNVAK